MKKFTLGLWIVACLSIMILGGCGVKDEFNLKRFSGKWMADIGENGTKQIWIEEWIISENPNLELIGSGKIDESGVIEYIEDMTLTIKNGKPTYTVVAHGQNEEKPVEFVLTSHENNIYKFENPQHDFPQYIIYEFMDEATVNARVGAPSKGEMIFRFRRTEG